MKPKKLLLILLIFLIFPFASLAQPFLERTGRWMIGGGVGLTEDPDLYALRLRVDYYITDEISVGPFFQYGFKDSDYIFGLSGQVKYLSLIHISEPTRRTPISYAVFCLKKNAYAEPFFNRIFQIA